ncbi:hypothetical protein KPH14_005791 [Odynerus spinipes]|uniref:Uncharacterized protein n=1 Tax=Odynerus spinipes TaxID=1348599 RepID=A0AAD9RBL8_9HYME|nr:hypothetical protein KPH14_005791 [Odynerus spinipes]
MTNTQEDVSNSVQVYLDHYPDYYYESWNEEYEEEALEDYREDSVEEESSETSEDSEILNAFFTGFDLQDKLAASRAQEKKKRLQKLLGAVRKKDDDVSVETIITPEEKVVASESATSESSIHPCLKDIDISDSQMKLSNLATAYPIPNDPGISPAFSVLVTQESFEEGGIYRFIDHVKSKGLKPIRSIVKMLETECIDLRFYGIDSRIVEIICYAVQNNASIQTIDMTDNWLTKAACYHLGELLKKNTLINLILSKCRIGPAGAEGLRDGLALTSFLVRLDLNACDLDAKGLEIIASATRDNESLEELCLANNNLNIDCTDHLCYLIAYSKSIKWLDLSWNSLFDEATWRALARVMPNNYILIGLNVAWNGIAKECVRYLTIILRRSHLEVLDLRSNMLTASDVEAMWKTLSKNNVLEELYLGSNPLGTEGVFTLVSSLTLEKSPDSNLRLLNLENVWGDKNVIPELEKIENEKPWLQIKLGGIFSSYELVGPDVMTILLRRAAYEAMAQKRKKRRRNFGHFVLTLTDRPIRRGKFRQLIRDFRLRLSKSLIDEIIAAFPAPRKTVDQGLLKAVYLKEFPNTKPPPEKPSKKKGKAEVKEEIKEEETLKPKQKPKSKRKSRVKPVDMQEIGEEEAEDDWYNDADLY